MQQAKDDSHAVDLTLVERFRGGDQRAFGQLIERHQRGLYRVLHRYTGNVADTEDLLQRTLVKAIDGIGAVTGELKVRPWLYRIAINTAKDFLRQGKRAQLIELDESVVGTTPAGESLLTKKQQSARLRKAVSELPTRQREVLTLRVQQNLPYKEIAEMLGCSLTSAKVNFHHAVNNLRAALFGGNNE